MNEFCRDIDIARLEPVLFGGLYFPWQVKAAGTSGTVADGVLTDSGADFQSSGIQAGDIISIYSGVSQSGVFEIVSVDSATQIQICLIRGARQTEMIKPVFSADVSWRITTFALQLDQASLSICERFGIGFSTDDKQYSQEQVVVDDMLGYICAALAVSMIYRSHQDEDGYNISKSVYYRTIYELLCRQYRISVDIDGDGIADVAVAGIGVEMKRV